MFRLLLVLSMLFGGSAFAHENGGDAVSSKIAVGVGVGSSDGISVLYKYNQDEALQGGISIGRGFSETKLDYLSLHPEILGSDVVVPYVGLGGSYSHEELEGADNEATGIRLPFGLHVNVPETPIQFAVEIAPTFQVESGNDSYVDSSIAVRLAL